jgi:G3E family GTPase
MDARLPVSVLTGFLGSGKTTLLGKLLRHPAAGRVAVVINEFGEIGLDHDLIATSDETVVQLESGCLCCALQSDLVRTLRDLHIRRVKGEIPEFERVVIETTGLADPAPILQTLMADPLIAHHFRLNGVITLVDATSGEITVRRQPEALKQIALADRLLITKADIATPGQAAALRARLGALSPGAPVLEVIDGEIEPGALLEIGLYEPATRRANVERWLGGMDDAHGGHRHDGSIRTFSIRRSEPLPGAVAGFFFTLLQSHCGPDLLRVKGILSIAEAPERPMVIQGVQHVFHPPVQLDAWPSADRDTRIVFIVRDLEAADIERLLDALEEPGNFEKIAHALPKRRAPRAPGP